MSELIATQITAVATAVLAVGAIVTAVFAYLAFRKQSQEVTDQAGMLKVASEQLREQQALSAKQTPVLELQAEELRESLAERKREAEEQRRRQASQVAAWFGLGGSDLSGVQRPAIWGAFIRNESPLPVTSARVSFHYIHAASPFAEDWSPVKRGGPPERIRVIPPRAQKFVPIPSQIRSMIDQCDDNTYAVSVEFTDAAGYRWERDPWGALRSLDAEDASPS